VVAVLLAMQEIQMEVQVVLADLVVVDVVLPQLHLMFLEMVNQIQVVVVVALQVRFKLVQCNQQVAVDLAS
jgi:hypothetical protein